MLIPPDINKKILRKMKYSSDQQGIMNRYLSEGSNWEDHLLRCRTFIKKCLKESNAKTVAVLGSGWLLDLPFEYLRDNFSTVYLIDIVHPPQIINKTKGVSNIHLVPIDITGGAVAGTYWMVQEYRKSAEGSLLDIAFQATLSGIRTDYIVSLNILNQLDILLMEYVSRFMDLPEEEIKTFRSRVQHQHIGLLSGGHSCIISDVEERVLDRKQEVISAKSLVYADLPAGSYQEEWTWDFDRGLYNKGSQTEMLVKAIRF